jgi:hypothetical protein
MGIVKRRKFEVRGSAPMDVVLQIDRSRAECSMVVGFIRMSTVQCRLVALSEEFLQGALWMLKCC